MYTYIYVVCTVVPGVLNQIIYETVMQKKKKKVSKLERNVACD